MIRLPLALFSGPVKAATSFKVLPRIMANLARAGELPNFGAPLFLKELLEGLRPALMRIQGVLRPREAAQLEREFVSLWTHSVHRGRASDVVRKVWPVAAGGLNRQPAMSSIAHQGEVGRLIKKIRFMRFGDPPVPLSGWGRRDSVFFRQAVYDPFRCLPIDGVPLPAPERLDTVVAGRIFGGAPFGEILRRLRVEPNEIEGLLVESGAGEGALKYCLRVTIKTIQGDSHRLALRIFPDPPDTYRWEQGLHHRLARSPAVAGLIPRHYGSYVLKIDGKRESLLFFDEWIAGPTLTEMQLFRMDGLVQRSQEALRTYVRAVSREPLFQHVNPHPWNVVVIPQRSGAYRFSFLDLGFDPFQTPFAELEASYYYYVWANKILSPTQFLECFHFEPNLFSDVIRRHLPMAEQAMRPPRGLVPSLGRDWKAMQQDLYPRLRVRQSCERSA